MRTRCRLLAVAVCLVVSLLLYWTWDPNPDPDPASGQAEGNGVAAKKFTKPNQELLEHAPLHQELQEHVPHQAPQRDRPPLEERKQGRGVGGGGEVKSKSRQRGELPRPLSRRLRGDQAMHLAVVACGGAGRLQETLTMLKSALLFSLRSFHFHIFSEETLAPLFQTGLSGWPRAVAARFQFSLYPISFSVGDAQEWKKLFKPCAAQRLFLPVILKEVDSLLYVDTDVLFLRPMEDLWSFLHAFNATQLAAMAPEHEVPKIGWYSRFARHPFYGVTGVNSGVMLMNLTRIRSTLFKNSMIPGGLSWEDLLHPLYQKYKNHITWGDQDLLNIIFHYNPECLFTFPCQWNYRPDHCMYGSNCQGAEDEGVSILHGNRGVYHDDKQPAFKVVYDAIHNYPFEDNLFQSLFYPLQTKFLDTVNTLCGRIPQVFLKQVEKTMKAMYEKKVVRHAARPPHQ